MTTNQDATVPDAAVEAAARELWERGSSANPKPWTEASDAIRGRYRMFATAALTAAAHSIAAQAKVDALRESADEFGSWGPTGIAEANALRNRAATIEGTTP